VQVAVSLLGRPWAAVQADVVEGFVVANGLRGPDADGLRRLLWAALHTPPARSPAGAAA
jgi:hypothetical protein